MKKLQFKLIFLFITSFILICLGLHAQVKTKIFSDRIPERMVPLKNIAREIFLNPPHDFLELKTKTGENFGNRFASSLISDIKFNEESELVEGDGYRIRSLRITAKEALNISFEFGKFNLSQNALLSIYTNNQLTDSITSKENNVNNIWATRVYQGNSLNIVLKEPVKENKSVLEISKVNFGYKKYGVEYGNQGASAACEINVNCTLGNGWDAEKNSVALIVANGFEWCTGSLVMNTCGNNIPYLLTADHCLEAGNVNNWVFQFQYWSSTCTPNAGWIEDIQFNGCNLKANSSATDFALLQLNQIPPSNSGISYAGWSRNTTGITQTTIIHHPAGDLMKITRDDDPPAFASFGGASTWKLIVDHGATEGGSSGSPYFDQNRRIIGQHYGINDNNLPICDRKNKFGGRFDLSWTGGGTNSTRLSNWLDPSSSDAMTTNTTAINNLTTVPFPNILSIELSPVYGEDCNSVEISANVASNTLLTWTTTGGLLINGMASPQTITGNSVTITSPVGGDGYVQATFNNCVPSNNLFFCPCPIWPGNPEITWIWSSPAQGEPLVAYVSPADPNVDRYIWMVAGQVIQDGPETDLLAYNYPCTWEKDLIVIAVYGCGASAPVNGGPYSPLCSGSRSVQNVVVYPNPASSVLNVKLKESGFLGEKGEKQQGNLSQILSITLFDKTGKQKKKLPFAKGNRQVEITVSELPSDVYFLEVSDGIQKTRVPVIIKR